MTELTTVDAKELENAKIDNNLLKNAVTKGLSSETDIREDKTLVEALDRAKLEQRKEMPKSSSSGSGGPKKTTSISSKFNLITIEFKPVEEIEKGDSVSILGEFNQWQPEIMYRYTT